MILDTPEKTLFTCPSTMVYTEKSKNGYSVRAEFEKFNRPSPDWPVFSGEFEQWAPAGDPEKNTEKR